ncbi:hypothetical protein Ait01nite_039270 [Actinoplanes italicus]|uniref:Uncharacterized protein n=1 Tax=Actinoplanes italicus TaxID=113567 RepID=A0A2T0JX38_9ACTN|nr:hypothetical protein [Actinoplanes italicus]PRX12047.1 hypothetical protein CLV67_13072 [Actinoplanes italicus]GIE30882.1 hypothetical protein Ait01nite_039270 [Actinoplanes italicus]
MKRFVAAAVAGVTALTLTVGCANQLQQLEPKLELKKAAENLGAASSTGFTIRPGGSVDDLIALAKKESGSEGFTDEDADILRKLYNSSFTVAWDKGGEGVADDKALLNATIDGVTGAEIRVIDKIAYVKVPVRALAAKFGAPADEVDQIAKEAGAEIPGIDKLIEGGWISIDSAEIEEFTKKAGVSASPASQQDSDKIAAELKTSAQNLLDGADVVRDEKDKKHLVVTTSTTKAHAEAKRFVEALEKIATKEQSSILEEAIGSELDKAPADKPIVLDLWIDNGKFEAFEINLLQFVEGNTGRASVRVDIASSADIVAPTGATKIDLAPIFQALGAGLAGTGAGPDTGLGGGEAKTWAELVGRQAIVSALGKGGKPSKYLKQAAEDMAFSGVEVKVVRTGVAEVTSGSSVACVTVPATTSGDPKVVDGPC